MQVAKNRSSTFDPNLRIAVAWPRPAEFLRVHPALLLTLAATLISLAGWLILRRRPRAAMTVALLISAIFVLAARERVRPPSGVYRYEIETPLSPGVVGSLHLSRSYGPSPLPAEDRDSETMRTSVTGASGFYGDAEVRTSSTPVSMGVMRRRDDWVALTRWSRRRELGDAPSIRIRSRDAKQLVLDYVSPFSINYLGAEWLCGETLCWGETAVSPGTQGRATIRSAHKSWPEYEKFTWNKIPEIGFTHHASTTRVSLVQKTSTHARIFEWLEPVGNWQSASFLITDREMLLNGSGSFAFALPHEVSPTATALISVKTNTPSSRVNLAWATGSTTLAPTGRDGLLMATRSYFVPPPALREILANRGIVHVTVSSDERLTLINPFDAVSIEIWEKKP
jgi:hypothetical protein